MIDSFKVFNGHRIGSSHVANGNPCEDFSMSYQNELVSIAVISDGHGDKNCFRSAKGAQIVCEVAVERIKNTFTCKEALESLKNSPERIISEIEKSIIHYWNVNVENDIITNPISDEELLGLDEHVVDAIKNTGRSHKVYGCTLIAAVFFDDFWFGIHIGDGKCVAIQKNGLYKQPIPWDNENCVGNRSTSICSSRAYDSFRFTYGEDVPVAVFVASDGVDESFDENGLNKFYYTLACWVKALSTDDCKNKLDEMLCQISQVGSGDDVSVSCIVDCVNEIKKPFATSQQVAEKMEELYSTLLDIEGRCSDLVERKSEVEHKVDEIEREINELEEQIRHKKEQLNERKAEHESVLKAFSSSKEQLDGIISQFEEAKDVKKRVDDYWKEIGEPITDNFTIMSYTPKKFEDVVIVQTNSENAPVSENTEKAEETPREDVKTSTKDSEKHIVVVPQVNIAESVQNMNINENKEGTIVLGELPQEQKSIDGYTKTGVLGNLFKKQK
ncbi:MAG: protein phosphatase 2C domain-containing protein [Lachnospiraceae bacterium]|nr:protein phosphatase 2C domain-containing protein [Lachnospiraceae bacterium]